MEDKLRRKGRKKGALEPPCSHDFLNRFECKDTI
jgi:hypothetical protein